MPYVTPPPALVVRLHRPERSRRLIGLAVLAWIAAVAGAFWFARGLDGQLGDAQDHTAVRQAQAELETLRRHIAVLERSEQVARAANADLQQTMRDRQEEIAALRADLAFYSRLTGGGTKREGLAVQGVHLEPVAGSRAYNFSITLTQNLKTGQIAAGRVRISVTGVRAQKLVTLAWTDLAPNQDSAGLEYAFKYFQRVRGTLMLPDGFAPNRIRIEADASTDAARADQDFAWSETLANEEVPDVQQ